MTELSVVVPVYGCADCLSALCARIRTSVESFTVDYEIVLVDDRSPDGAWGQIVSLAAADPRIRGVRLSRNFGQDAAITAGLSRARGDWTVVMDCDLEEPPEMIPRLWEEAHRGFKIVRTTRTGRRHGWFRRVTARAYRLLMLESERSAELSTLSMLARPVVETFLSMKDVDREYVLVLDWLGFSRTTLTFEHRPRHAGRSAYTFRRMLRVGLSGMLFRTTVLLRWVVLLGFVIAGAGALLAVYDVVEYFRDANPSGYTSLAVLLLLLVGFVIVSLGVVGLYVGRIFEQVKGRPLFVVETELDADQAQRPEPLAGSR